VDGVKYALHLLPSGILSKSVLNIIGNGVVLHIPSLLNELKNLDQHKIDWKGRLLISDRAHLLFDFHKRVDELNEVSLGTGSIGTTRQGIGPCYTHKAGRNNIRVGELRQFDLFEKKFKALVELTKKRYGETFSVDIDAELVKYKEYASILSSMIVDTVPLVYKSIKENKKWLIESANATMLDIDFGTYPYVTSSNPSIGGACTGLGFPPSKIQRIIGVVKAYTTRVGAGPFPTELNDEIGKGLCERGFEFGTTTGRRRRCGWLDLVQLKYCHMINDFTEFAVTKLDILTGVQTLKVAVEYKLNGNTVEGYPSEIETLEKVEVVFKELPGWSEDISKCRVYSELPENAKLYIQFLEKTLDVPVRWIGVGPEREAIVDKH